MVKRYKQGGIIYIEGNGGSAADAQHSAADAMTVDSFIQTAIGNDYGYEQISPSQLDGIIISKNLE